MGTDRGSAAAGDMPDGPPLETTQAQCQLRAWHRWACSGQTPCPCLHFCHEGTEFTISRDSPRAGLTHPC